MTRPTGVTLIAALCFIGAGLCALLGLLMMVGGGFVATMIKQQGAQGGAGLAGILAGLGAVLGVFLFGFAVLDGVLGWGLLNLKEWARIVTIVLYSIGAMFQGFGVLGSLAHFNPIRFVWSCIWIAVDVLIIWYLVKPEVKAAFQPPMARGATA